MKTPSTKPPSPGKSKKADSRQKESILADIKNLKKLWPYLQERKGMLFIAMTLIPVIALSQMALPLIVRHAIDDGIVPHDMNSLTFWSAMFLIAVVSEYVSRASQSYTTALAVHSMIKTMRRSLVTHILRLSSSFHDRNMSGALVTRATSDFDNLSESLNMGVLTSLVDFAVLFGIIVGMFSLNWQLALGTIAVLPFLYVIVTYFSRALKSAMMSARVKLATLNGYTQEALYGQSTIKLLTAENDAQRRFKGLNNEYRDAQMSSVVLDALMYSVLDGIASITMGLLLWYTLRNLYGASAISAGIMVAFVQYIQQFFEPLKQLATKMAMLQGAFSSIDRIFGLFDQKEFVQGDQKLEIRDGAIEFRHVSFAYKRAAEAGGAILRDITFTVPPRTSVALVGPTGSGKTTISRLIAKLYDGYDGSITIDGQDLALADADMLRRQMAIVPQDIVLFDGSIAFNIGLDQPEISRADIERAAAMVGADKFIKRLPKGLDTDIREQGSSLSHGEKQLIAFARALAKRPKIVILDEATSSIDLDSEAVIQAAIKSILSEFTVIVIAHRLSTIKECDQIIVVEHGRIAESGKHDELLARGGLYAKLHK